MKQDFYDKAKKFQVALLAACFLALLIPCAVTARDKTYAGLASYSTRAPEGVKLPPSVIYRTDNLQGPVPTSNFHSFDASIRMQATPGLRGMRNSATGTIRNRPRRQ